MIFASALPPQILLPAAITQSPRLGYQISNDLGKPNVIALGAPSVVSTQ